MEKLIELLNEYEGQDTRYYDKDRGFCYGWGDDSNYELEIISKKYGFIKWLVDNDKIDFRKVIEKEIEIGFKLMRIKDYPKKIKDEDVEEVLMLLSVQDNPIEFLISILK